MILPRQFAGGLSAKAGAGGTPAPRRSARPGVLTRAQRRNGLGSGPRQFAARPGAIPERYEDHGPDSFSSGSVLLKL
jgi:hypothetical protein